jgi:hypothetical protein
VTSFLNRLFPPLSGSSSWALFVRRSAKIHHQLPGPVAASPQSRRPFTVRVPVSPLKAPGTAFRNSAEIFPGHANVRLISI